MPKPICFAVMPFGTKETGAKAPAPSKVNFDALWEKAFVPAIESLGYQAVRADQDLGALIIQEMLERLYFSDLVIADLSIPNGNVYYEIGIRHAARNQGCVLLGASWSKQLFDVDQMRQVRYPLPSEVVDEATALLIRAALIESVPKMANGTTPMFQTLSGYPGKVEPSREGIIKGFLQELSAFQAEVRAVRIAPKIDRRERALVLRDRFTKPPVILAVALEIMQLLRDCADWQDVLDFINSLPPATRELPLVREQYCLAQSKAGDHVSAIAALEQLIETSGPTSERHGLIGGRYKRLSSAAADPEEKRSFLNKAIAHYELGMRLDLNEYYCSCNLPRLYRTRAKRGDEDRAKAAAQLARFACERAREINPKDEWVRPTLLGMAFDAADVTATEDLAEEIEEHGIVGWMQETTLADLEVSAAQASNPEVKAQLQAILGRIKALK